MVDELHAEEWVMLPTLTELDAAAALVYQSLTPTPQYQWPLLSRRFGRDVGLWVKHENHHPVGAFKVRGGLVYLDALRRREPGVRGVISATRGNHGQSVAFAASRQGLTATIVVPRGNSREKNAAMKALGAELIEHGDDFTAAAEQAERLAAERGLHMIPSFHRDLLCGVASYWLELLRAVPELDVAYVPIGLGSGLCAGIAARNALGLSTELVGVVSSAAPAYALSLAAGEPVEHPSTTVIADGMAVRRPNPEALAIIKTGVARVVQVSDTEIKTAMRAYFSDTHNVAEGAGAAPLAAALAERERLKGRRAAVILCGGNVDSDVYARVLSESL